MVTKFPTFNKSLRNDITTRRLWFGRATAHDFESHDKITENYIYWKIFVTHFGQLTVIFFWISGNLFHIACQGNFETWNHDPLYIRPFAHLIIDPHYGQPAINVYSIYRNNSINMATSGIYHWWYTIGIRTNQDLYARSVFLCLIATLSLFTRYLHLQPKFQPKFLWFKNTESRLNHHLSILLGTSSVAWRSHLIHIAIPTSRGSHVAWDNCLNILPHPQGLNSFFIGNWIVYTQYPDSESHVFGINRGVG